MRKGEEKKKSNALKNEYITNWNSKQANGPHNAHT